MDPDVVTYYANGTEEARVFPGGKPSLEYMRLLDMMARFLPPAPGRILDVGGGPGTYAVPLQGRGYDVALVDPVRKHVRQARDQGVCSFQGEAGRLGFADESFDTVLLMGPLYHLTEAADRQQALREAHRVLRPEGFLFATAISRYSTLLMALYERQLDDPVISEMVALDLADGQHRNTTGDWRMFTRAYFHTPAGLEQEVREARFSGATVYGVEGPGWPLGQDWAEHREAALAAARTTERTDALIGFSLCFCAAAIKG